MGQEHLIGLYYRQHIPAGIFMGPDQDIFTCPTGDSGLPSCLCALPRLRALVWIQNKGGRPPLEWIPSVYSIRDKARWRRLM